MTSTFDFGQNKDWNTFTMKSKDGINKTILVDN